MRKFEYKFVEVPEVLGPGAKAGDTFRRCEAVVAREAEQGWRLKQIHVPFYERSGALTPHNYQVILERELD